MDTAESIIDALRTAFRDVPRGEMTLHQAQAFDEPDPQFENNVALDCESRWEEVPDASLERCSEAMSFLDPLGWRYYLPAFLIWTLRHFETSDALLCDQTIYTLSGSGNAAVQRLQQERFQQLNAEQSQAVFRFLRYMQRHESRVDASAAGAAIREYWCRLES